MKNENFIFIALSNGSSFEKWNQHGLIHRELSYYKKINDNFLKVKFNTYNYKKNEKRLLQTYIPNAEIIYQNQHFWSKIKLGNFFSSLILPIIYKKKFNHCKLVRSNQFSGAISGLIVAKLTKKPFILRGGYLLSEFSKKKKSKKIKVIFDSFLEKILIRNADHIIVTYEKMMHFFIKKYNVSNSKITLIGNSIDTNLFFSNKKSIKRDILVIAKFEKQKNHLNLLKACKDENYKITFVGSGSLKNQLEFYATENNIEVKFIDNVPNIQIPSHINAHKIFVLPSFYEGNPKALLEAMSCEAICLASNIEEHTSIIKHGENGYLTGTEPTEIRMKLRYLLNNYENLNNSIGKNARKKIRLEYSMESNSKKEIRIYRRILNEN